MQSRVDLEKLSIEGVSTAQVVSAITFVQDVTRKAKLWDKEISHFIVGQKTLERQRYSFASNWLYVDRIQGEWAAFFDILKRKDNSIQAQIG